MSILGKLPGCGKNPFQAWPYLFTLKMTILLNIGHVNSNFHALIIPREKVQISRVLDIFCT